MKLGRYLGLHSLLSNLQRIDAGKNLRQQYV
jgi:hypothetical protein